MPERPADAHGDRRGPRASPRTRRAARELRLAAHEEGRLEASPTRSGGRLVAAASRRDGAGSPAPSGRSSGSRREERRAQRVEIGGDAVARTPTAPARSTVVLSVRTSIGRSDERRRADQRLVEHHADAVPVRSRRRRVAVACSGRHVRRRAHDLVARRRRRRDVGAQLGRHAEVEDDDAPLGRDEDVRRLDVAVKLAGRVERVHAFDELPQRGTQLCRSRPATAVRRGAGLDRRPTRAGDPHAPLAARVSIVTPRSGRRSARGARVPLHVPRKSVPRTSSIVKKTSSPSPATSSCRCTRLGWTHVGEGAELLLESVEAARGRNGAPSSARRARAAAGRTPRRRCPCRRDRGSRGPRSEPFLSRERSSVIRSPSPAPRCSPLGHASFSVEASPHRETRPTLNSTGACAPERWRELATRTYARDARECMCAAIA